MVEEQLRAVLEKDERRKAFSELQADAEKEGTVPPLPFLVLRQMKTPLQILGGVLLGIFLGVFALLTNFIIFVWLLHLSF